MPDPTLLLGTTKGAFLLKDGAVSGPHCGGWTINHIVSADGVIWAGGGGDWTGAGVWRSEEGGETWVQAKLSLGTVDEWAASDEDFAQQIGWDPTPPPFGKDLHSVWSLHHAHGVLYAGAKPGTLLESHDGGETWQRNEAFANFPDRDKWFPGGAGLTLHTILSAPEEAGKLWLGVSAAGVFASEDGGKSWDRRNRLSNAAACESNVHAAAPNDGEAGHCVHNMARAPGDLIYQQNHHGVYRSRDGGRHWDDISAGLPSRFGFPIGLHPDDANTIWTLPLNGDSVGRYPPDASAAIWKSTDGGESWQAKRKGLPQENCYFTVLRQAMAVSEAAEVFFGTNTGSIFASHDEGESWAEIARHLPTILSVEILQNA